MSGGGVTTDPNNPTGGAGELSKKHFDDLSSWDSWE